MVPLKKSAVHPGEPDLLAPWAPVSSGRNEEKWFRREKEYGDSPAVLTSRFPGRMPEPRGTSKSGSCKENVLGSFFVAELEGSRRARHRGGFRERPKS